MTSPLQLLAAAALGAAATHLVTAEPNAFVDADHGYRMELPDLGGGSDDMMVVQFYGPPSDDGTANVNVQVMEFDGAIEDYLETSRNDMKLLGLEMLDEQVLEHDGAPAMRMESRGDAFGPELHFLSFAVLREGRVTLLTGTCAEGQWKELGEEFSDSFDSLEFFETD